MSKRLGSGLPKSTTPLQLTAVDEERAILVDVELVAAAEHGCNHAFGEALESHARGCERRPTDWRWSGA